MANVLVSTHGTEFTRVRTRVGWRPTNYAGTVHVTERMLTQRLSTRQAMRPGPGCVSVRRPGEGAPVSALEGAGRLGDVRGDRVHQNRRKAVVGLKPKLL